jgi:hypothetical protein
MTYSDTAAWLALGDDLGATDRIISDLGKVDRLLTGIDSHLGGLDVGGHGQLSPTDRDDAVNVLREIALGLCHLSRIAETHAAALREDQTVMFTEYENRRLAQDAVECPECETTGQNCSAHHQPRPCPCACNSGAECGGCGHAGCGGRP